MDEEVTNNDYNQYEKQSSKLNKHNMSTLNSALLQKQETGGRHGRDYSAERQEVNEQPKQRKLHKVHSNQSNIVNVSIYTLIGKQIYDNHY